MTDAGNDFGASTQYGLRNRIESFNIFFLVYLGSTLIKCGQTHQKLGLAYKDFIQSSAMGYIQPLRSYLEGEMKSITVRILSCIQLIRIA